MYIYSTGIHIYPYSSVHICLVQYTILLYSSVWVYEKNSFIYILYTQYIYLHSKPMSTHTYRASSSSRKRLAASRSSRSPGLCISTSSSVPGGHGVLTASSNRISSSQGLLLGTKPSKAVATKAVKSNVCLSGTGGCRGGGDTLSVSGVYGVLLPDTIWLV